jgi:hypothetical protein
MRRKTLFISGLILALTLSSIISARPTAPAQAQEGETPSTTFKVYFTEANEEASRFDRSDNGLSRLAGLLERLGAELYTLEWRNNIPSDADLIIVAGPTDDLAPEQTARLWVYLISGGRLLILAEPIGEASFAFPEDQGLFELCWTDLSIRGKEDAVVTEGEMQTVPRPLEKGEEEPGAEATPDMIDVPVLITDLLVTNLNPDHPITSGIKGELAFFGARSLEVDSSIQIAQVAALAYSNDNFYGETRFKEYQNNGVSEYLTEEDTLRGALPLAAVAENPNTGTRIVLIGDRDFATNGGGFKTSPPNSPSFLYPNNVQFMLNAIAWLLETETEYLAFPTPGPTATPTVTSTPTLIPTETPISTPTPASDGGS